jgi:hypothetical protein
MGRSVEVKETIDELHYLGEVWKGVLIEHGFYRNGTRAFELISMEEGPLSKPTTNLEAYGLIPKAGCFWIKNYGEHDGLGSALVSAGVVQATGRTESFGPYDTTASEYLFTKEYEPNHG